MKAIRLVTISLKVLILLFSLFLMSGVAFADHCTGGQIHDPNSTANPRPCIDPPAGTVPGVTTPTTVEAPSPDGQNPFVNVASVTCTIANWLRGPVGIAIGFLVLVAGLIAMQVANRDAVPMITRAVVGTALLIGAGATFAAIITANGCGD
jgi:hypothetical protein